MRFSITDNHRNRATQEADDYIIFVINHDPNMVKTLKNFFGSTKDQLVRIIEDYKILIS
jgi:hypothetical protein